jgi:hypothetical protein
MEKSGGMSNGKMLVDRIRRIETIYYTAFDRDIPKRDLSNLTWSPEYL